MGDSSYESSYVKMHILSVMFGNSKTVPVNDKYGIYM